jgi:hypothetical protein
MNPGFRRASRVELRESLSLVVCEATFEFHLDFRKR